MLSDFIERVKESLSYDPLTGHFRWIKISKYHKEKLGSIAGTLNTGRGGKRYISIGIDGKYYLAHRLAWLYQFNAMPEIIDHKDGNSINNAIANLRSVTQFENCQNHKDWIKPNGLHIGVCTTHNGKYRARITVNKKVVSLGSFKVYKNAVNAYKDARDKFHDAPCRNSI